MNNEPRCKDFHIGAVNTFIQSGSAQVQVMRLFSRHILPEDEFLQLIVTTLL